MLDDRARILFDLLSFTPWPEQEPILSSNARFKAVSGGGQGGKSVVTAKDIEVHMAADKANAEKTDKHDLLYWLVAADYDRTRREFGYLVDDFATLGLLKSATKRVDPGEIILLDGTIIRTKSARDPRTLAMEAPDGVAICEASQVDHETYLRITNERAGPRRAWVTMSGTMEGSLGWFPGIVTAWASGRDGKQSFMLPTWSNLALFPGGRDDPEIKRIERESPDDFFMERIAGVPRPPHGLVFPEVRMDFHVGLDATYEPGPPVYLAIDPGYDHAYALLAVQEVRGQLRVIDEIYERGLITDQIIDIALDKPWWPAVPNTGNVIDRSAKAHAAMPAVVEAWLDRTGRYFQTNYVEVNEGTERLKTFLKADVLTQTPKLLINPKCQGLLSEFGVMACPFDNQVRAYSWQQDREGNTVGDRPRDKYNDAIKALIYYTIEKYGYVARPGSDKVVVRSSSRRRSGQRRAQQRVRVRV
jgi:hypothetical protein